MTPFGRTPAGDDVQLYTLENKQGLKAEIINYGATLVRLFAPDRRGELADVVLGFDDVTDYIAHSPYFGATIGRCGNRIAHGRFSLDGKPYVLAQNNTPGGIPCHLHGGVRGFDKVMWQVERVAGKEATGLRLQYRSADSEEGYPGNVDVTVTYTLGPENELRIDYLATADQPTPVNLTHHSYFNLAGAGAGDVLSHVLTLAARHYTPVDAGLIPVGTIEPVKGTPFDFTDPREMGRNIADADPQLQFAGGYDHNFVLDRLAPAPDVSPAGQLFAAATVWEPRSGRILKVETTEPGLQFYSGNFLTGALVGKEGRAYPHRGGFCLETQHFPDAPNQPSFPSVILRPGETRRSTTVYRFDAK